MCGRISSRKRIERMIRIVASVRRRGHDVRIRIVGHLDTSQYSRSIIALARRHRDWICLEGRKVGTEKVRLLSTCRYGIHGREGEVSAVSVAEMIKAGCIASLQRREDAAEISNHEVCFFATTRTPLKESRSSTVRSCGESWLVISVARVNNSQRTVLWLVSAKL